MSNRAALLEQLAEAARRSVLANGLQVVGKDGRERVLITKLDADGDMAKLLRKLDMLPDDNEGMQRAQKELLAEYRKRPEWEMLNDAMFAKLMGRPARHAKQGEQ